MIEDKIAIMITLRGGAKECAQDILALINSEPIMVKCEDCQDGVIMTMRTGGYVTPDMASDAGMPEIAGSYMGDEPEQEPCETCKGTGYRAVMVRRVCPVCKHYAEGADHSFCSGMCKGTGFIRAPFTHLDIPDIIDGSATLEWGEE